MINYETRQQIIAQALSEIQFARDYKQGKTTFWKINEDLYYGRKLNLDTARANVDLGEMAGFVHTVLAKIDNPLTFKYVKRKLSQLKRVNKLNALKQYDQQRDNWDIKDIAAKKQALIYGRAIYSYYADNVNGYKPHLDNVDVYDFLIDPSAGGIDIDRAKYLGDYGVVLSKSELKAGMKNGIYLKTETQRLLDGSGNVTESTVEETNKFNRTIDTKVWKGQKNIDNPNYFKFWRWGTTFNGERYYLVISETGGTAIRIEKLTDVFASNDWWYWTYAAFPDLTEFWTPSYCDYVRDTIMAKNISINQALDNAEQINKPQKVVNVGAIENLAELKYRRDGYIKVKKEFNADQAIQTIKVPSIDTPFKVYQIMDNIQQTASGVTAGSMGVAEEDKVGIYEGNQANAADRFGLLNKTYSFGTKRFAKLYENGVREKLTKKIAVDIMGPDGVEIVEFRNTDIFRNNEEFGCLVESSTAELALSESVKRTQMTFLTNVTGNPAYQVNAQKSFELQATIAGFDEETIRQLQDTSEFGDAAIMSEAERDIEMILDGKKISVNENANTAYKQRFVDYMLDNKEDISMEQFDKLVAYLELIDPIIDQNMIKRANKQLAQEQLQGTLAPQTLQGQEQPLPQMQGQENIQPYA